VKPEENPEKIEFSDDNSGMKDVKRCNYRTFKGYNPPTLDVKKDDIATY
jgi:hypothetical protein